LNLSALMKLCPKKTKSPRSVNRVRASLPNQFPKTSAKNTPYKNNHKIIEVNYKHA